MRKDADTIVIGAGISGLTVAHGLKRRGRTVAILEAGSRAGGVIGTQHHDGALYELGPNSTKTVSGVRDDLSDTPASLRAAVGRKVVSDPTYSPLRSAT